MRAATAVGVLFGLTCGAYGDGWGGRSETQSQGRVLFQHEWTVGDRLGHGDGLGPVFNARSCVACHGQGGPGGGGPNERNVQILTPILVGAADRADLAEMTRRVKAETGLTAAGSVVLHRFGTNPAYARWRKAVLKKDLSMAGITLRRTQRNTPAVFGAGLIDAIPDAAIEEEARREHPESPEVIGRVSRLPDGRIGRFGWKGHTASLKDFVLTACSVELGLDVPDHHQSADPSARAPRTPRPDLTSEQCDALVEYVRALPAPRQWTPAVPAEVEEVEAGRNLFAFVGCSACHTPSLGGAEGLYSDLLLHDMGPSLSDSAAYYGTDQEIRETPPNVAGTGPAARRIEPPTVEVPGPRSGEWRTPPLWGVRDSAPYLHDGRARTLDDAIRLHDGQGRPAAARYRNLTATEKEQLLLFLMSLTAPGTPAPAVGDALRIRRTFRRQDEAREAARLREALSPRFFGCIM